MQPQHCEKKSRPGQIESTVLAATGRKWTPRKGDHKQPHNEEDEVVYRPYWAPDAACALDYFTAWPYLPLGSGVKCHGVNDTGSKSRWEMLQQTYLNIAESSFNTLHSCPIGPEKAFLLTAVPDWLPLSSYKRCFCSCAAPSIYTEVALPSLLQVTSWCPME